MDNDEYDHFNRVPPSKVANSDVYLTAALQAREAERGDPSQRGKTPEGRPPPRRLRKHSDHSHSNGDARANGASQTGTMLAHDNAAFQVDCVPVTDLDRISMQATEI